MAKTPNIGYVTHEIAMMGLAPNGVELPQMYLYSGGLGTLAGAIARAAKNLNVPMTIFSILARYGYYDQTVYEKDGQLHMGWDFVRRDYSDILEDTGVSVSVDICGKPNIAKVWKIPGKVYGTVDVYLLDSDIPENDELGRLNTRYLYSGPRCTGGNDERQIAQDMILGIGAVRAAEKLGLNIGLWHMNESHTVCTALEILRKQLPAQVSNAIAQVKSQVIYTNHTPDPAGNKRYDIEMFTRLYRDLPEYLIKTIGDDGRSPPGFNLGVASLRLSRMANAVSKKHLEVTKAMFACVKDGAPIISVTNGSLLREYFQEPEFAGARTWEELQRAKIAGKRKLNEFLRGVSGKEIDVSLAAVTWARRFAQYKRPDLLLKYSRDWLIDMLANRRFTFIIAGKPHPDDHDMVSAWTNLLRLSKKYQNLIIVPNYDMRISKILKVGSDAWLNTPRVGMEACGTSGQSAASNGAINISTIDGWMCEADANNFFAFGTQFPDSTMDAFDANNERSGLTAVLGHALDTYYNSGEEWYRMALRAKFETEKVWNADRMMQEYIEKMYTAS